jgi:WD40 repeat protein
MHTLKAVASSTLSLPTDNYIYSITASAPGTFAAISSDDSLRVFDAGNLDRGSVVSNATHAGVTSLRSFAVGESQLLATGGRDGKVKVWDVRTGNGPVMEMQTGEFGAGLRLSFWFFQFYFFWLLPFLCMDCEGFAGTCRWMDACFFSFRL